MLDISQYDYQDRHQQLQQDYRNSVALEQALVKWMRQASNQIGTWFVKVGKHLQTRATTVELQEQS